MQLSNWSVPLQESYEVEVWKSQIDEIIEQVNLSKSILNVSFNFIFYQEICKKYMVTSDRYLHMCII